MKVSLHKSKIASVKYTPCILALANFISNVFYFYRLDTFYINILAGCSVLLVVNCLIDSYVFKFCHWHRVLLSYSVLINIINWIDYNNPLLVNAVEMLNIIFVTSFVFLIITIIVRIKYGCRKVESDQGFTCKDCQGHR